MAHHTLPTLSLCFCSRETGLLSVSCFLLPKGLLSTVLFSSNRPISHMSTYPSQFSSSNTSAGNPFFPQTRSNLPSNFNSWLLVPLLHSTYRSCIIQVISWHLPFLLNHKLHDGREHASIHFCSSLSSPGLSTAPIIYSLINSWLRNE